MKRVDAFIIGGGGCGSDVTYALSGAGLAVMMAEREVLGGECANFGCDPTKAMLKSARVAALARRAGEFGVEVPSVAVDFAAVAARARRLVDEETSAGASIYEERGATVVRQEARLAGERRVELADGTVVEADHVVLATGSAPAPPPVPGLEAGGYWTNREAIWHGEGVPGSLAVLGGGAIGLEFAQMYSRFGSRVTVVEALERVLPGEDEDSSRAVSACLEREGIRLVTGRSVTTAGRTPAGWRLEVADDLAVEADRLLVATGRRPVLGEHDLEAAGIELDDRGRPVLGETLRTTNPSVWAAGDATGDLLFTHVGGYEAEVVVADILGRPFARDYRVIPRVTYCEPEVASVGQTEREARESGRDVVVGFAPFSDNARSFVEGEGDGHVKVVADRRTGEVLGGHVVGEAAGELVHEIVAVMAGRVPTARAGDAVHAYPTRAESVRAAFREAAAGRGA